MKEYNLPAGFLKSNQVPAVLIYPYNTNQNTFRNRVVLTTHLFAFLADGSKEILIGEKNVKLEKDHFALVTAGNCFMSEKISEKGNYSCTLIFFTNELLQAFHLTHKQKIDELIKNREVKQEEVLNFRYDAFTRTFAQSLSLVPAGAAELIKLKLEEILLYLLETQPGTLCALFASTQTSNKDLLFKNMVEGHIDSNLSVQELAFLCHMSLSTFKRKFTKLFGDSPTHWIRKKRMERAGFLLTYNKERPSDLYLRLGYKNFSSFTQSFKNVHGKTPKEYQLSSLS